MKEHIILIVLAILIVSCAPKVEIDAAEPAGDIPNEIVEEPGQVTDNQPEEAIIEEPEKEQENIVEIKADSFYPKEKTIDADSEITWVKKDPRDYKIACYLGGNRITLSPDLKEGDSFTYRFLKKGEYTCITFPYGLRNVINVESKQALLSPTGRAVVNEGNNVRGTSFAAIALIAGVVLLFFIYGRRRE